ncbi:MAG: type I polyketide synthase, partial [Chloroflexi bacterium]|nr:type I polyketide synthase [Chloroflexota bacterium]
MSDIAERISNLSPKQLAVLALKAAQAKRETPAAPTLEPIAVIGIGCRFPNEVDNPERFWQLLAEGVDAIREVPSDRWDIDAFYDADPDAPGKMTTRWGAFIDEVDRFDAEFFGIAPREVVSMDPQQRLLLEVAWEALEHAGRPPQQLVRSLTGVFVGITTNDYSLVGINQGPSVEQIGPYTGSGNASSVAAGRISYVLGLQGPSLAVDTACSSSLVTVHLACQSLRNRECHLALAGGVNLILSPEATIYFSKARMMAPDGRCKTFDAAADGYARGEGCGMLVLKRLSDALADGDNILALIRGTAVNHDGHSNGLTAPNGLAQEAVIGQALQNGGVQPQQVGYVETHGTGTSLGDPIEVEALGNILGRGRSPDNPLAIGSVKTNIGHLEGAAGVAGLIKVVLALQHEEIPPHLHLNKLNPYIAWNRLPVVVPTQRQPWRAGAQRRIAGVSSFGFSGTNAHVVVEEAPLRETAVLDADRPVHLFTLSARNEAALLEYAGRYARFLAEQPTASLADLCYSANSGRAHFAHRLAIAAGAPGELEEALAAFVAGSDGAALTGQTPAGQQPKVAFLFTGQGAQYAGMGRELYATSPTFRTALDECAALLAGELEAPLLEVLFGDQGALLDETAYTQPALFALEYALAQLWQSWGVTPDLVLGHSVGEYVAAVVAGVFSLADGLKLISARSRLMQGLAEPGEMAAVWASEAQVTPHLAAYAGRLAIAAVNGPQSVVISGASQAVTALTATLEQEGLRSQPLVVSHAFHSPLMEPMLAAFAQVAAQVAYH